MAELSPQYRRVAEANRQYYAKTAQLYETSETCLISAHDQRIIQDDLMQILTMIPGGFTPRVLDACGGSGNIALKLLARDLDVTVCNISLDMLSILHEKTLRFGYTPKIICTEVGSFLDQARPSYDLIVFSSALHHLEDINYVVGKALERLTPGVPYTVFDPTPRSNAIMCLILWLDYLWFKISQQPGDLLAAIGRRLHRMGGRLQGGDQPKAAELTEANLGYEVVWHKRYAGARHRLARFLIQAIGGVTYFKLLIRKPL